MASNLRVAPESVPPKPAGRRFSPTPVSQKNGKWYTVLLAGGSLSFAREIRDKLAETRDVYIKYHLDVSKPFQWQRPIPPDVDFVVFLKDVCSHAENHLLTMQCKRAGGVRMIRTSKRVSMMLAAMGNYGVHKTQGLPLIVRTTMIFDDDPGPTEINNCTCKRAPDDSPHASYCAEFKPVALAVLPSLLPAPVDLPVIPISKVPVELTVSQSVLPSTPGTAPRGMPTPEIGAIAVHLFALCMAQDVDVLIVDGSLTINARRPK